MNNNQYERIGESIWNTYEDMAYLLAEKSALPRISTDDGEEWVGDNTGETDDPDAVEDFKIRRRELAKHLKNIRKGKAEPEQKTVDPNKMPERDEYGEDKPQPPRSGPRGSGERTHAEAAADLKSDLLSSRGREAEEHKIEAEKRVSAREKQATKSRTRAKI